ncbi:MAG: alpha/beta fold hydrolase [Actinomycetota bacterium]
MPAIQINDTNLHVETNGSGPPLVLLHGGLGLDHTYFRPAFDQLADRATLVYYDHRGNGRSDRPADYGAEMTLDQLVADTVGLLDHLGHEQAVVLGHSYGGFLAQLLAAAHPDRLRGLILCNTVPAFDYQPAPSGTDEQLAAFGAAFSGPMADDEAWHQTWSTIWPMYFHRWDAAEAARVDAGTHYVAEAWNTAAGLLATFNTIDQLPGIDVPTLVVSGRHDFITPPEPGGDRIAGLLPNAELAVFEDSGHYPFMEEESAFFARLGQFLDGLPA